MSREGYGVIVAFTHFSLRNSVDIMEFVAEQPSLGGKKVDSSMARHFYDLFRFLLINRLANVAGIDLHPVVTKDTLGRKRYKKLRLGAGMKKYLEAGREALQNGGVVPIALQTGRRKSLYEEKPEKSLSTIMKFTTRHTGFKKYAVLFVGLEHPGVEDYSKEIKKINWKETYRLNIGAAFTAEEIFQVAGEDIDAWAYKQFEALVSPAYLRSPTPTPSSPGV